MRASMNCVNLVKQSPPSMTYHVTSHPRVAHDATLEPPPPSSKTAPHVYSIIRDTRATLNVSYMQMQLAPI